MGVGCYEEKARGRTELVYLRENLFRIAEEARKSLGLSRSGFYRYCIIRTLQELGYLDAAKLETREGVGRND